MQCKPSDIAQGRLKIGFEQSASRRASRHQAKGFEFGGAAKQMIGHWRLSPASICPEIDHAAIPVGY
jgi:hypothetical protein